MNVKIIRSSRRTVSLSVDDELCLVVRAPYNISAGEIDKIIAGHDKWIKKTADAKKAAVEKYNISDEEICRLKKQAQQYIPDRVRFYSQLMGLIPQGVKITRAKKRFGSCSGKNSLCFSCFLMLYPEQAIDYVVVHELAHIKYRNHGSDFYALIGRYMPDYKQRIRMLKD